MRRGKRWKERWRMKEELNMEGRKEGDKVEEGVMEVEVEAEKVRKIMKVRRCRRKSLERRQNRPL